MATTRFFKHVDGSIEFIMRGFPPPELAGYIVDENDPRIFHPILPPCAAREFKDLPGADCCPAARNVKHCTKYGYWMMTLETCQSCVDSGNHIPINISIDKL